MAPEIRKRIPAGTERQKLLLLVLILVFIGVVLYRQTERRPGATTIAQNSAANSARKDTGSDPVLMLNKLNQSPVQSEQEKRNLFAFHQPPPPVIAQTRQQERQKQEPEIVCGDAICMPGETYESCPADCQPPPPPEIPLKYIGYLSRADGAVVFLTDGREVYMGRENDIIANKYRVLKITDESVELGYLNLDQSRTIPFAGNRGS